MHYNDGDYYNGNFEKDKRNGIGEMHYNNHDYYNGSYIDDKKEGRGKYYYNDSDYYDGEFKDDKRHGNGKVYNSKNEIRCEGIFKNGKYKANIWEQVKGIFNSNPHCY